jgi:hypothetical protein
MRTTTGGAIKTYRGKLALRERRQTLTLNRGSGSGNGQALLRTSRRDDIRQVAPVRSSIITTTTTTTVVIAKALSLQ